MNLSTRKIVIAGLLGAIAIFLGVTRLGFIPVPNVSGNATIEHIPAILAGVLEGPVVGVIVGFIFGLFSFLQASIPLFADPLVSIVPRLFIGVTAWLAYRVVAPHNKKLALAIAAIVGTLTNTVLVLGMAVIRNYLPPQAIPPIIPQAIAEVVIAVILVTAIGAAAQRMLHETGSSRRRRNSLTGGPTTPSGGTAHQQQTTGSDRRP